MVCPGAAEHIHRCRPPLPVHTLSPCSLICLFMLGFTRVTLIVKRKKKKGRMYLEMLVKRFLTRPRGSLPQRDSDPEGPRGSLSQLMKDFRQHQGPSRDQILTLENPRL